MQTVPELGFAWHFPRRLPGVTGVRKEEHSCKVPFPSRPVKCPDCPLSRMRDVAFDSIPGEAAAVGLSAAAPFLLLRTASAPVTVHEAAVSWK